jgi:glycosyltransferase involved in cell wall biosynthesis
MRVDYRGCHRESQVRTLRANGDNGGMIEISVIVPHLDALDDLARCVAALEAQSQPRTSFEIIVADNGSACGLKAVQARVPSARVVSVTERGAGPARNAGVAISSGRILAFTDSDCVPDRHWLAAGVAALAGTDFIGGAMRVSVVDAEHMTGTEAFETVFAFNNKFYVESRSFTVTANLVTTRAVFDRAGPFAKGISEDVAWCRAAIAQGLRISYAEKAVVSHPARPTYADLERKWQRLTAESFELWISEGGTRTGWFLRAIAVLASPFAHIWRVIASDRLPDTATRFRGLATLFSIRSARCVWMVRQALTQPAADSVPAAIAAEREFPAP